MCHFLKTYTRFVTRQKSIRQLIRAAVATLTAISLRHNASRRHGSIHTARLYVSAGGGSCTRRQYLFPEM
jgi:hypothetical protein